MKEYAPKDSIKDPVSGTVAGIFWTATNLSMGLVHILTYVRPKFLCPVFLLRPHYRKPKAGVIETTTAIPKGSYPLFTASKPS